MNLKTLMLSLVFVSSAVFASHPAEDKLNQLLRGELAAVSTYEQAMTKLGDEPDAAALKKALADHKEAAEQLTAEIKELPATPSTDAGAWGVWSQTVMGSAKILGDETALKALKEGEEHGLKQYKEAVNDKNVPMDVKNLIKTKLMTRQQEHIASIDRLMKKK